MRRMSARRKTVLLFVVVGLCAILLLHKRNHILLYLRQMHMGVPSLSYRMLYPDGNLSAPSSVCHTPQCFAAFKAAPGVHQRIPSVRHVLWKNDQVSSYFAQQLKTWHNIHPAWKYILWQDSDLEKFVAKYYAGALGKFRSLPSHIMRVDMIRYMILHKFGGVYADLDYMLIRPLDRFQKFPAVVTRETEAHSLFHFGMAEWPPPLLANPAFLMSEPRHPFFLFCINQLTVRPAKTALQFAGPFGLSELLAQYAMRNSPTAGGTVFVPASNSFYPYVGNNLNSSSSQYRDYLVDSLNSICDITGPNFASANLTEYCKNVNQLDPITDAREPVHAVHDSKKSRSSYDKKGSPEFYMNPVDIRTALPNVVLAESVY